MLAEEGDAVQQDREHQAIFRPPRRRKAQEGFGGVEEIGTGF